jgi:hypothetical protein
MHRYPSDFFSFSLQISCWFPRFSCWIGELQAMFLLPHFKGNSWCLMIPDLEGKKGVAPSSKILERNQI